MTIQADPAPQPDPNATPAPSAPETPPESRSGFTVPLSRSAVLDVLASRRAALREEVDPEHVDSLIPATRDAAIDALRTAAGEINLDRRDDVVDEEEVTGDEPVSDAEQDTARERQPAAAAPAPAPAAPAAPGPKMTTVIIDGREVQVAEDIVARAVAETTNKRLARLETASPSQPSAAPAGEHAPAAAPNQPVGDQGDGAAAEPISDEELERIQQQIQFGEDKDARQALRDLVTRTSSAAQQAALAAMTQMLDQRETHRQRTAELEQSVTKLRENFPEVMGDADYRMLAIEKVFSRRANELVQLGYDRDVVQRCLSTPDGRAQIMATADQEVAKGRLKHRDEVFADVVGEVHRKVFGNAPPKTQRQTQRQPTDRREAKRNLAAPPPTASARAPIVADEPVRQKSASDVVQAMRKQRGQAI